MYFIIIRIFFFYIKILNQYWINSFSKIFVIFFCTLFLKLNALDLKLLK